MSEIAAPVCIPGLFFFSPKVFQSRGMYQNNDSWQSRAKQLKESYKLSIIVALLPFFPTDLSEIFLIHIDNSSVKVASHMCSILGMKRFLSLEVGKR